MEKTVFVKIDKYRDVLDVINLIKKRVEEAKAILHRINSIKAKENSEIENWKIEIDGVEKKVREINNYMCEPEV